RVSSRMMGPRPPGRVRRPREGIGRHSRIHPKISRFRTFLPTEAQVLVVRSELPTRGACPLPARYGGTAMTILWENDTVAGCATLCESVDAPKPRKARLVLAGKLPFATRVADHFRRQGWHVHVLESDEDLYRTVHTQRAS